MSIERNRACFLVGVARPRRGLVYFYLGPWLGIWQTGTEREGKP